MEFKCEVSGFGLPGSIITNYNFSGFERPDAYKPWGTSTAAERPAWAQKIEM